jgi:hypothetical protein
LGQETIGSEGSIAGPGNAGHDVAGIGGIAEPEMKMLAHPDDAAGGSVITYPGLCCQQKHYESQAEGMAKVA